MRARPRDDALASVGGLSSAWARGRLHDPAAAAAEFRRELAACSDQGATINMAFFQALLAQLEADTMAAETALKRIDDALALAGQGDNRCYLSFIHRLRGEILLKRDPSNSAPAEEAFRTAIDVARQQSARSLGLQAALALAKLLRSSGQAVERTASSRPRSKAFPRRRRCRRSRRRRRWRRGWHRSATAARQRIPDCLRPPPPPSPREARTAQTPWYRADFEQSAPDKIESRRYALGEYMNWPMISQLFSISIVQEPASRRSCCPPPRASAAPQTRERSHVDRGSPAFPTMSKAMWAPPSAASRIALASAWTSPVSATVEARGPAARATASSAACLRPTAITRAAPIATPSRTAAVP